MFRIFIVIFYLISRFFAFIINSVSMCFSAIGCALRRSKIKQTNQTKRGVVEIQQTSVSTIAQKCGDGNMIITGGNRQIRSGLVDARVNVSNHSARNCVIFHGANPEIGRTISHSTMNIGIQNPSYDPLQGYGINEIIAMLLDVSKKDYGIQSNGRYFIEGMLMYLRARKIPATLEMLIRCPYTELYDKTDELIGSGEITDADGREIQSKLAMGQSEMHKIEDWLSDCKYQLEKVLFHRLKGTQPMSIRSAIEKQMNIIIDISTGANTMLNRFIAFEVNRVEQLNYKILLVIDGVVIKNDNALKPILMAGGPSIEEIFSCDDFYTMCNSDDQMFNTLYGHSRGLLMMHQSNGVGAAKLAEAIGQYDLIEDTYSEGGGKAKHNNATLLASHSSDAHHIYGRTRELIIKPEETNRMQPNEAYFINAGEAIMHTHIV